VGDGLFSFIRAEGQMSKNFDAFRFVANLDDFYKNVDVYDTFKESSDFKVVSKPKYQF
jgi:hypothetical protein